MPSRTRPSGRFGAARADADREPSTGSPPRSSVVDRSTVERNDAGREAERRGRRGRHAQARERVAARHVVDPEGREAEPLDARRERANDVGRGRADDADRDSGAHHVSSRSCRRGARRRRRRPSRPARIPVEVDASRSTTVPACQAGRPSAPSSAMTDAAASAATTAKNPMPRFQVPSVDSRVDAGEVAEHPEDRGRRPRRAVELDPRPRREHAREVRGDAAAGDVARASARPSSARSGEQLHERAGVEARRLEQRLAPRGRRARRAASVYAMPVPSGCGGRARTRWSAARSTRSR